MALLRLERIEVSSGSAVSVFTAAILMTVIALVSLSPANSGEPTDQFDMNGQELQLRGGAEIAGKESCVKGECIILEEDGDYAIISQTSEPVGSYTVSFWMRPSSRELGTNPVLEWHKRSAQRPGFHVWQYNHDDDFYVSPDMRCVEGRQAENTVVPGEWKHYSFTLDKADRQLRWYVGGKLVRTVKMESRCKSGIGGRLYIGKRRGDPDTFDGRLDQLAIYNRSLTARQIRNEAGLERVEKDYSVQDTVPRICILNMGFGNPLVEGNGIAPDFIAVKDALEWEGWKTRYTSVAEITNSGLEECGVVIVPNSKRYPVSAATEPDCGSRLSFLKQMKKFMENGGFWIGPWKGLEKPYKRTENGSWQPYRCKEVEDPVLRSSDSRILNVTEISKFSASSPKWTESLRRHTFRPFNRSQRDIPHDSFTVRKVGEGYLLLPNGRNFSPEKYRNAASYWNRLIRWWMEQEN